MKTKVIYLLIVILFSGCIGGLGFDTKDKVVGNYYLVAPDDESQLSLDYCDPADQNGCSGVIDATVFAVGYNKEFIIAKQHPNNNRNTTNYYLFPIKNGAEPNNNDLIGPLTLDQFNYKRKELNIPDSLRFTIVKNDLK